ncbi:protein of unknown function [Magnetospirillum gryphiswaldense MSR-1 v2]|uniref:Uncharacterized protein n=1 Tax=Magnetospirillum gryphiswaldense (strain DSM 6361 / JCM 21280 / NBRC 15271 / MSR-1) TaxID=431944 RepID=V6F053_MAGGM|nr:protein of unknown function [Magnetospirillum gryphiswaldense MSR-1 v2]
MLGTVDCTCCGDEDWGAQEATISPTAMVIPIGTANLMIFISDLLLNTLNVFSYVFILVFEGYS